MATSRLSRRKTPELSGDAEQLAHLLIQKAKAGPVGLHPGAVNDELRDGPLAHMAQYLIGRAGHLLDINLGIGDLMLLEKALCFAAVPAPDSGIDSNMHAPHDTGMMASL